MPPPQYASGFKAIASEMFRHSRIVHIQGTQFKCFIAQTDGIRTALLSKLRLRSIFQSVSRVFLGSL